MRYQEDDRGKYMEWVCPKWGSAIEELIHGNSFKHDYKGTNDPVPPRYDTKTGSRIK